MVLPSLDRSAEALVRVMHERKYDMKITAIGCSGAKVLVLVLALFCTLPVSLGQAGGPVLEINWSTTDGGGIIDSSGGVFTISGSIAQPDAGVMAGGSFTLVGGFWAATVAVLQGDCDGDSDVDLADFAEMESCLSGPGGGQAVGCECFDFDDDADIDLQDFADFQVNFTGG